MKKIIAMLLVLGMLCFAGCGGSEDEPNKGADSGNDKGSVIVEGENRQDVTVSNKQITMEELLAAPESPAEDFKVIAYTEDDVRLEGYLGDEEIVVIPESLGVTKIAKYVFANDCPVKAIRFSNSVNHIEQSAFINNSSLQLVACGEGLREIKAAAFQSCSNLREVELNEGLESIEEYALSGCENLLELHIPSSVTEIEQAAICLVADGFVLYGEAGSVAEEYAKNEGLTFQAK